MLGTIAIVIRNNYVRIKICQSFVLVNCAGNEDKIRVFQDRWLRNGSLAQPAAQYNQLLQLNVKELLQPVKSHGIWMCCNII
jgi:hypothetical protein